MKKIFIPLCLLIMSEVTYSQRSHQFDASNRLFDEGKELFWLKNYSGCIDKLEAFKQKAIDADLIQEADYMLVCSAYEQGRPKAEELLKDYLEAYPDTRHSDEINFLIGSVHFGRQEYQKAIYWFNAANIDLLSPEQQETCSYRLAYSLLQTGDKEKARVYFSRIAQVGVKYKEAASYYIAHIDYATGQYNNALIEFTQLKENPDFKEQALYHITQIYFIQNKFNKVASEGEALLSAYPNSKNNTEIYRILGNSYYQLGDENKAISNLSKYYTMTEHPTRGDLYILGVCYYNKRDYNNGVKMLRQTVRENDALSQNAYLYLGQSYLELKDRNNARMAFEAAASTAYDKQVKEAAMYNYALLIHETNFNGFGESVTAFENFLNEFPDSKYADKVNDYLVEVYMTTKNYSAALSSINKIKQPSQKILEAKQDILFQLGTQAFTNMKTDEAIKLFNQSIALGEYDPEARSNAYFWRGESYYRLQEFTNAITDYRTYINNTRQRNTDTYALAHYNLGYSYFKQKDYPTALNSFRKYTELETNKQSAALADAYNRIGDCLYQNRQFTEAAENYTRAEQLLPSAGDYSLYQKAFLLGLQKDYTGKIKSLDRLVQDYPQSQYIDDALFEKGRTYLLMDNNAAASQAFEKLTREFPQSSNSRKAGVQLALIYFNNNQLEKAADAYKKVISEYPGSDEAKTALQDLKSVYIELNDINSYANYVNSLGGSVKLETSEQDSLTYMAAEKLFMRGDNEGAQRSLAKYLQSFPNGSFSSNANYYLGSIAFNKKEYEKAENNFNAVIASGDTKFMEEAVARTAEMQYLNNDFPAAEKSFKQLQNIAEKPENKQAARIGILRCAQQNNNPKDALLAAEELLKETKLSPEISVEARLARAKAYIALKQESKAMTDLKELSKDTRTVQGAEAKYLLAQLYYNNKEDKNAEKILMNFIEDGTPHQYWLARGFILLADVYIRQGDDFQARQYLTSLKNNYKAEDEIQGMIEDRLAKLKK